MGAGFRLTFRHYLNANGYSGLWQSHEICTGVKDPAHFISDSQMFKYVALPPNTPVNFGTGTSSHGIVLSGHRSYELFLF